jgi:hypothetical protein
VIITVTPNPSVDRTVFLDDVVLGSVNRSRRSRSEPSGKGVNVALALHAHDVPTRALVTAGGSVGAQLQQMLTNAGLHTVVVPIAGEIRSNISLTQPNGCWLRSPSTSQAPAGSCARAACLQVCRSVGTAMSSRSGTQTVCRSLSTRQGTHWPRASLQHRIW